MVWNSRRSNALALKHCVASDNAVASSIGLGVLSELNGTAADAAVAVGAALNVLQPATCGLGGDAWILYFDNKTKKVHCLCGQGKTPERFTPSNIAKLGLDKNVPLHHPICVGVPGAPAAFCDLHEAFGNSKLSLSQLFKPAVELAKGGFAVAETSSLIWREGLLSIREEGFKLGADFLVDDQWPKAGRIMRLPNLARTYEDLGQFGKSGFYDGRIARSIADCIQNAGGFLSLTDVLAHESEWIEPISTIYKSKSTNKCYKIWETPITTQGVVVLKALNLLQKCDGENFLKPQIYYPNLVNVLSESFQDLSRSWLNSPDGCYPDASTLLSPHNTFRNLTNFSCDNNFEFEGGKSTDTTYFCVTDQWGNACSCVYSNYCWFGTGFVPEGCGFTLNNRPRHFWEFMHRKFAPRMRPFATIMAGMMTDPETNDFLCDFGVMGGQNQPQAHLQAFLNMTEFGLSPQEALDKERIRLEFDFFTSNYRVLVEENLQSVAEILRANGHSVAPPISGYARNGFGRGNIITKGCWWDQRGFYENSKLYWAGTDPRGDGCALGL